MATQERKLHAVKPNEKPVSTRILTLSEAIEGGDYLQILLAQRRDIVTDLPNLTGPAKAAMHNQFSRISKEIEALVSRDSDEAEGGANVEDGEFDAKAI